MNGWPRGVRGPRIMRINLKGLNFATKRLADGTRRTYWYAWRGGPLLHGEPSTPEFVASYNKAVASKVATPQGVILSMQGYQASEGVTVQRRRQLWPRGLQLAMTHTEIFPW